MGIIDNITKELKLPPRYRITWLLVAFLITLSDALLYLFRLDMQKITDKLILPLSFVLSWLFWIAIGLFVSLLILHKKTSEQTDEFKDYIFNTQAGSWIIKSSPTKRACAKCKAEKNILSPLAIDNEKGVFVCPACGNESKNIPFVGFIGNGRVIIREN